MSLDHGGDLDGFVKAVGQTVGYGNDGDDRTAAFVLRRQDEGAQGRSLTPSFWPSSNSEFHK